MDANPFESPQAPQGFIDGDREVAAGRVAYVDGLLYVPKGFRFPDRCVKCNRDTEGYRLHQVLGWYPKWLYLLILIGFFPFVLGVALTWKQAPLHFGLCVEHRRVRRKLQLIGYALTVALVVGMFAAFLLERLGLGLLLALAAPVTLAVFLNVSRPVSAARITRDETAIRGCGAEFVNSLA